LNYLQYEVVVVDNAPSDGQAREIAERWGARYLVEPIVGLSRARNTGARACHTQIVVFLDDDAIPEPNWLSELVREFDDPMVMAVTGRILPLSVESEEERILAQLGGSDIGGQGRKVDKQTPAWFEITYFGGLGSGGNMAIRRRMFDEWPGFDVRLGRGVSMHSGEDNYAFFSIANLGYRVVYAPEAIVRHPYPKTWRELQKRHLRELAASTGLFTFLFFEEPRCQRAVIKYITQALVGVKRTWRNLGAPQPCVRIIPRWRRWIALLSGPFLYFRAQVARALEEPKLRNDP
jgi:cellulose synthase/poly-beta-1,6-N-acetylglucosamine synthase-like glycosyltransferase